MSLLGLTGKFNLWLSHHCHNCAGHQWEHWSIDVILLGCQTNQFLFDCVQLNKIYEINYRLI